MKNWWRQLSRWNPSLWNERSKGAGLTIFLGLCVLILVAAVGRTALKNDWMSLFKVTVTGDRHVITGLSGDLAGSGNYLYGEQSGLNSLVSSYYRFDGIDDYIAVPDNAALDFGTDTDFTISILLRPDNTGTDTRYIVSKESGGIGWGIRQDGANIYFRLDDNVTDDSGTLTPAEDGSVLLVAEEWRELTFVIDADNVDAYTGDANTDVRAYVNGELFGTELTDLGGTNTYENVGGLIIGADSSFSSNWPGQIARLKIFNKALTLEEIKRYITETPPFKYQDGDNTDVTSGTLAIGKEYILRDFIAGDNFSNIGAGVDDSGTHTDGQVFIAIGTTPTVYTNSSIIDNLGVVAEYLPSNMNISHWFEQQNENDGTITGTTLHANIRIPNSNIVAAVIDDTTPDASQGNVIKIGSNTVATAITNLDNAKIGTIYTLVTVGGGNWSTIADSGNFNLYTAWAPDSATDTIQLLCTDIDTFIQVGTPTNN